MQLGEIGKLFVLSTTASSTASLTALIADVAESATATNTWNSLTISDATKNTSLEFNLTGLNTDGKHYLVGVDQAGNVTVIKEGLSFTLDATAPSYIFTSSATISKGGSITISSSEEGKIYLVSSSNSPLKESDILAYPSSQFDDIKMGVLSSGRYLPDGNISGSISTDIGLSDGSYKIYAVDKYGNLSLSTTTVTIGASGLKVVEAYIDINGTKYYPGDLIPLVNHESSHTAKLVFKFSEKFRIGFVQNVSNSSKLDVISKTFSRNSLGTNFYNYKYINLF